MTNFRDCYLKNFGSAPPPTLSSFIARFAGSEDLPVRCVPENSPFVVEIQYLLDFNDPKNYDVEQNRFAFAMNTDGHKLMVETNTPQCEILQCEFDQVDCIGVNLEQLLSAPYVKL